MSPIRTRAAELAPGALTTWRERHGYGVRALARALGLSHPTILDWESGAVAMPAWLPLALETLARRARTRSRGR